MALGRLLSLAAGVVVAAVLEASWSIHLVRPVPRIVVRVLVTLAVTELLGSLVVGVAKVQRHWVGAAPRPRRPR